METAGLNVAYDLLPPNKLSLNTLTKKNSKIRQPIDKIYFLICNSCYWCATYFGIDDLESLSGSSSYAVSCHVCNSCNTELIPILTDKSFRIEYNLSRGMEIEFYRSNVIVDRRESTEQQIVPP
jgi:hypothetical protein